MEKNSPRATQVCIEFDEPQGDRVLFLNAYRVGRKCGRGKSNPSSPRRGEPSQSFRINMKRILMNKRAKKGNENYQPKRGCHK